MAGGHPALAGGAAPDDGAGMNTTGMAMRGSGPKFALTPEEQVRHVLTAATLAPSVHNTQPWHFVTHHDGLDLYADDSRRLAVLDPTGRQVRLSCGAALGHCRIAARGLGLAVDVELQPDPQVPDLLARLRLRPGTPASEAEVDLATAMLHRHTYRGVFEDRPVPAALIDQLRTVAEAEGAMLRPITRLGDLVELEVLLAHADALEQRDDDYRAELGAWVGRDASFGDGIPVQALPTAGPTRGSSVTLREFHGTTAPGMPGSPADPPVVERPLVVLLSTIGDDVGAWLHAGQAMGTVLLHAASVGVLAQPLGQVTDLPGTRARLGAVLGLVGVPQLVLRMGYADERASTPRRSVEDVVRG